METDVYFVFYQSIMWYGVIFGEVKQTEKGHSPPKRNLQKNFTQIQIYVVGIPEVNMVYINRILN
jgi:hypothetical protein